MDVLKFSQKFKRNSRYFHVWNGENSWKFAIQIRNKIRNCYEKENAFDLSKQSADLFPHWLWSSKRHSYDLLHFPARIFCKQKQTFFCVSSIDLGILRYVLILLFIVSALSRMLYGWMVYTVGGVGVLTHHNFHIPFNYGHRLRHGCKLVLKCICHVNCQITNHNSVCVCVPFLLPFAFLFSSSYQLWSIWNASECARR